MANKIFVLIVIGTGSGGSVSAGKYVKAGWNVAQIDSSCFGGTCARRGRGCDPKKNARRRWQTDRLEPVP